MANADFQTNPFPSKREKPQGLAAKRVGDKSRCHRHVTQTVPETFSARFHTAPCPGGPIPRRLRAWRQRLCSARAAALPAPVGVLQFDDDGGICSRMWGGRLDSAWKMRFSRRSRSLTPQNDGWGGFALGCRKGPFESLREPFLAWRRNARRMKMSICELDCSAIVAD